MNLKRAFDIAVASVGIVVTAPITLSVGFAMAVANKSSPIFKQERIGLNNKPFTIYKIKTMNDSTDESGNILPDKYRTSKLGVFIRKTHLDELPQFYNVLKGNMSIVGSRPVPSYVDISKDIKRHTVKPGLTGITQISGKNSLSDDEYIKLDHDYVDNHSLLGDFMICLRTPFNTIKNRDDPHYRENGQVSKITEQKISQSP